MKMERLILYGNTGRHIICLPVKKVEWIEQYTEENPGRGGNQERLLFEKIYIEEREKMLFPFLFNNYYNVYFSYYNTKTA